MGEGRCVEFVKARVRVRGALGEGGRWRLVVQCGCVGGFCVMLRWLVGGIDARGYRVKSSEQCWLIRKKSVVANYTIVMRYRTSGIVTKIKSLVDQP
jgi:hypothetical protein